MPALAFRSIGAHASTGSVGSGCVPTLPAGHAATDFLLMFVEHDGGTVATPAGWAVGPAVVQASTACTSFSKTHTGSESDPTVIGSGCNHLLAVILAFSDPSVAPINTSASSTASAATAVSWPEATATENNTIVVHAVAVSTDSASTTLCSGYANASLGSLTERFDQSVTDGNGGGLAIVTGTLAAAGSTGITTATLASSAGQAGLTIVISPATADDAHVLNLADEITPTEVPILSQGFGLPLADEVTPTEGLTLSQGFGLPLADEVTPTEAPLVFDIGMRLSDQVTVEDTNQRGVDVRMAVATTRHNDFVVTITALP